MQRSQDAFKCLVVTAMILGQPSAGAGQFRPCMVGQVGIQPLFQRSRGEPQGLPSRRCLQRFKIQILDGLTT